MSPDSAAAAFDGSYASLLGKCRKIMLRTTPQAVASRVSSPLQPVTGQKGRRRAHRRLTNLSRKSPAGFSVGTSTNFERRARVPVAQILSEKLEPARRTFKPASRPPVWSRCSRQRRCLASSVILQNPGSIVGDAPLVRPGDAFFVHRPIQSWPAMGESGAIRRPVPLLFN